MIKDLQLKGLYLFLNVFKSKSIKNHKNPFKIYNYLYVNNDLYTHDKFEYHIWYPLKTLTSLFNYTKCKNN